MSLDIRSESGNVTGSIVSQMLFPSQERSVTGLEATYNVSMHSSPQDSKAKNNMLIRFLEVQYFFGSAGSGRSI